MSKALSFCLWSCIGVISEEGPLPLHQFSIDHPHPRWGSAMRRARGAHLGGMEGLVVRATSPGRTGLEVVAGLWPDERGSCDAKRLFWHHD